MTEVVLHFRGPGDGYQSERVYFKGTPEEFKQKVKASEKVTGWLLVEGKETDFWANFELVAWFTVREVEGPAA